MRKSIALFSLVFVISSCGLEIPTAVEVRGNPNVKFSAKRDFGEIFSSLFNDADLIPCTNTQIKTVLIRKEICSNLDISSMAPFSGSGPAGSDIELYQNTINLFLDMDDILQGFSVKPVIAQLFIYGSEIVSVASIGIKQDGESTYSYINPNRQMIPSIGSVYTGTSLPGDVSTNIILPIDTGDLNIDVLIQVTSEKVINSDWFNNTVNALILVWAPFEFIAGDSGAVLEIPRGSLFPGDRDLFGRTIDENSIVYGNFGNYINKLELEIVLNNNPFQDREMVFWSGSARQVQTNNVLKGNKFNLLFDEETMVKINDLDNYPFIPNFEILFNPGETLSFPHDFRATEFFFKAGINIRVGF